MKSLFRQFDRSIVLSFVFLSMSIALLLFSSSFLQMEAYAEITCDAAESPDTDCEEGGGVCCDGTCVDGVTECCCDGSVVECEGGCSECGP